MAGAGGWREHAVEAGGFRGCYFATGKGPPLVLVASTLVRARPYAPVVRQLARRFRVYALDMPGCGGASRLKRAWTFDQYAEWLGGALDALRLEGVTLVGHSNSGGAALVAGATLPPGKLSRIVVADGVGGDVSPSWWRVLLGRGLDGIVEPRLSLTGWHHLAFNALVHTRNFFGQIVASVETDLRGDARDVCVPVLLAWGARDHTMPPPCGEVLRSVLPEPHAYVSPTGSHDWIITNPAEFADAVGAFYDRTAGRAESSSVQ